MPQIIFYGISVERCATVLLFKQLKNVIILGNCTLAKINSSLQVLLLYSFTECPESFCSATHDLHVCLIAYGYILNQPLWIDIFQNSFVYCYTCMI